MNPAFMQSPNLKQKAFVFCDITNNWVLKEEEGNSGANVLYCVFRSKVKAPAINGDFVSELESLWVKTAGQESMPPMCTSK